MIRRNLIGWFIVAVVVVGGLRVSANPVIAEGSNGMQYTNTFHAQITYYCSGMYGGCREITGVTRDGQPLHAAWVKGDVVINGGSGIDSYDAYQFCDCNLSPGTYHYVIKFDHQPSPGEYDGFASIRVQIKDPPPGPPPANNDINLGEEVAPWDIPGPPWPQGLDCKAWCEDHPDGYTGGDDNGPDDTADVVPDTDVQDMDMDAGTSEEERCVMDLGTVNEETFTRDTNTHTGVDTRHEYKDKVGIDTAGQAPTTKSGSSCTTGNHGLPWSGAVLLMGLLILALTLSRRRNGET